MAKGWPLKSNQSQWRLRNQAPRFSMSRILKFLQNIKQTLKQSNIIYERGTILQPIKEIQTMNRNSKGNSKLRKRKTMTPMMKGKRSLKKDKRKKMEFQVLLFLSLKLIRIRKFLPGNKFLIKFSLKDMHRHQCNHKCSRTECRCLQPSCPLANFSRIFP